MHIISEIFYFFSPANCTSGKYFHMMNGKIPHVIYPVNFQGLKSTLKTGANYLTAQFNRCTSKLLYIKNRMHQHIYIIIHQLVVQLIK